MKSQEIRQQFLKYFKKEKHRVVPSSPVIPHDDPTLLFINAGMNQFKDVFLGQSKRDYTRACSSQKCVRVGGKHNDLENVGHTKRHLTFFEMLGNFSFGDYFKKEAIRFSWEVSTEVFGFDEKRIWPTVFREDDEAFELWQAYVPAEKITRFNEDENYWAMGDTGPCGPCSELLYDRGDAFGSARNPSEDPSGERFLEFWNLVFMQFNRDASGVSHPLPRPSIDTGAGLERVVSLKMDVDSVFETDILRSLIAEVENVSGVRYEGKAAFRVIADHMRSLSFAIADGAQPSNVDRGYVLRKLLRRAVRYGRSLGMREPFLAKLLPRLITEMGDHFPEIKSAESRIEEILTQEEEAFFRTLKRGGNLLNQVIDDAKSHNQLISGDDAFKLKDTYGLPFEEIELIAIDGDLKVDKKRYLELEEEAKERSRAAHKKTQQLAESNIFEAFQQKNPFDGYDKTSLEGVRVVGLVVDGESVDAATEGQEATIILNTTPFYAEKGGQVGDTGKLRSAGSHFLVTDCQEPYPGAIAHVGRVERGRIQVGDTLSAEVDSLRRDQIRSNHTATHLLHWALQEVLGDHVRQAGSVVDPHKLRFDFNHHKAMGPEELQRVEELVNSKVRANVPVKPYEMAYQEVQSRGEIKQFFGDKYGETVRVVDIDFSKELCGGTHVEQTGSIGYFRIAEESSIAAGVRRITAVTGIDAENFARKSDTLIEEIASLLKTQSGKLKHRVEKLMQENRDLGKELKGAMQAQMKSLASDLMGKVEELEGKKALVSEVRVDPKELKNLSDLLMEKLGSGILLLANIQDDRCNLLARVSKDLVKEGITAKALIERAAPIVGAKGGGKDEMAQAGGTELAKVPEALGAAMLLIAEKGAASLANEEASSGKANLVQDFERMKKSIEESGMKPAPEVMEGFRMAAEYLENAGERLQELKDRTDPDRKKVKKDEWDKQSKDNFTW